MQAVYLHHSTYPQVKLIDAMMCSMAVPFVFTPRKHTFLETDDYYVDGGIVDNYPIWVFNDIGNLYTGNLHKTEKEHISPHTLGLKLLCTDERNDEQVYRGRHEINNVIEFATEIVNTLILQVGRTEISSSYIKHTIPISTGDTYFLNFNLDQEQKKSLVKSGQDSVIDYFDSSKNSLILRNGSGN
jgi:NTE family protein